MTICDFCGKSKGMSKIPLPTKEKFCTINRGVKLYTYETGKIKFSEFDICEDCLKKFVEFSENMLKNKRNEEKYNYGE